MLLPRIGINPSSKADVFAFFVVDVNHILQIILLSGRWNSHMLQQLAVVYAKMTHVIAMDTVMFFVFKADVIA